MKTNMPIIAHDLIAQHNLTDDECEEIVEILGQGRGRG
jgi:hypothetical protein